MKIVSADQCFPKKYRLRNRSDYNRVFARRTTVSDGLLILYGCRNDLRHSRIGLSVSRKVGGAVVRNRWKRLIREAFRITYKELPDALDMVVIPRRGTQPTLDAMLVSLPRLATKLQRRLKRDCSAEQLPGE